MYGERVPCLPRQGRQVQSLSARVSYRPCKYCIVEISPIFNHSLTTLFTKISSFYSVYKLRGIKFFKQANKTVFHLTGKRHGGVPKSDGETWCGITCLSSAPPRILWGSTSHVLPYLSTITILSLMI